MAWLYKRGGKWWLGYRANGRQVLESTGFDTDNEVAAKQKLAEIESMHQAQKAGRLTERAFRELTGANLPSVTLAAELEGWLALTSQTTAENTHGSYKTVADDLKEFLHASDTGPLLAKVSTADVTRFLLGKRKDTTASTTNKVRKILSAMFKRAVNEGRIALNPVAAIKTFKAAKGERVKRRCFTVTEAQNLYDKAPDDFWRYMIIGELYSGLRMVDLILLRRAEVDMQRREINLEDEKTGKPMEIPIHQRLYSELEKRFAIDGKPKDFLWPDQAKRHQRYKSGSGYFSNQFYDKVLAPCGLVTARDESHKATGAGRKAKRQTNEISFHCLRHTFISAMHSKGTSQAVAKQLAGHNSDQVHALYTHAPKAELVTAINQLPEFVK